MIDEKENNNDDLSFDPFAEDFATPEPDTGADDPNAPVFDNQALADDDLLSNVAHDNAPKLTDENFPRYAMSGLLPIPLYRQHGNNSYGDFNKKGPDGKNLINYNYFPAFELMPLYGGTFDIPYENQPTESDVPVNPEPFDYNSFQKAPRNGYSQVQRSAKTCSEIFMLETRRSGGYVFECLVGYHITDADQGLSAARKLVSLIIPVRDKNVFPETIRTKSGVRFVGPFLDQMLDFVTHHGLDRITGSADLSPADKAIGERLHAELRLLLRNGVAMANTILNETEAEIKNPIEIKKAYDPPNLEIPDAPVSTDLYCLAHTDRIELDDKQLKASENIGSGLAGQMNEGLNRLADIAEKMTGTPAPGTVPANSLSIEKVEELLENQRKQLAAEFDEKLKSVAVGQTKEGVEASGPVKDPAPDGEKGGKAPLKAK